MTYVISFRGVFASDTNSNYQLFILKAKGRPLKKERASRRNVLTQHVLIGEIKEPRRFIAACL